MVMTNAQQQWPFKVAILFILRKINWNYFPCVFLISFFFSFLSFFRFPLCMWASVCIWFNATHFSCSCYAETQYIMMLASKSIVYFAYVVLLSTVKNRIKVGEWFSQTVIKENLMNSACASACDVSQILCNSSRSQRDFLFLFRFVLGKIKSCRQCYCLFPGWYTISTGLISRFYFMIFFIFFNAAWYYPKEMTRYEMKVIILEATGIKMQNITEMPRHDRRNM